MATRKSKKSVKSGKSAKSSKHIYSFGKGKAEGDRTKRDLLGGKGAGLAEMTNAGLPVPPGFTISTGVCTVYYDNKGKLPASIEQEMLTHLKRLEDTTSAKLGADTAPLLVSVRSGAKFSMPGMLVITTVMLWAFRKRDWL